MAGRFTSSHAAIAASNAAVSNIINAPNPHLQNGSSANVAAGGSTGAPSRNGSSSSNNNSNTTIVGLHYKIGKKIGEGSFGVIFEGTNMINQVPVAIKFEPRKTEAPQLRDEYRTYKQLNGSPGVPQAYYFGQEGLHNILVIDLLGPSLEDLFDWCGRKFSVKTTVQIAVQMISLIETVHEKDLIYRDIKPDNFLIGRPGSPDENLCHLVDFGMAKQYRDPRTKQHIPYREKKSLSGTARYMSINTHLGREQSRRDDLEALGHVFFYFLRGQLPWQGLKAPTNKQKYEKIGEKKRSTPVNELAHGYPLQFATYLDQVRNLAFEETPNYEGYRQLLMSALVDIGEVADGEYDWMKLNGGKGWDLTINKKPNLHGYGHPNPPNEKDRHHRQQRRNRHLQQQIQPQPVPAKNQQLQPGMSVPAHQQQQQQQQQAAYQQQPLPSPPQQSLSQQQSQQQQKPRQKIPGQDQQTGESNYNINSGLTEQQQQQQQQHVYSANAQTNSGQMRQQNIIDNWDEDNVAESSHPTFDVGHPSLTIEGDGDGWNTSSLGASGARGEQAGTRDLDGLDSKGTNEKSHGEEQKGSGGLALTTSVGGTLSNIVGQKVFLVVTRVDSQASSQGRTGRKGEDKVQKVESQQD
ncbi:hypothetical protein WICPIJ_007172 [Wickerhamomyces pijperi]|uniref:non-specific serine/threonine protein kinase n=1 Tax=Wickerhamomyces pijperi TaxID=599730 RepID=A0A9P8Q0N9_WICPI|nr:hypothetical protein WICPIJ_007172 [Wickerhamomyces pijperi]